VKLLCVNSCQKVEIILQYLVKHYSQASNAFDLPQLSVFIDSLSDRLNGTFYAFALNQRKTVMGKIADALERHIKTQHFRLDDLKDAHQKTSRGGA